MTMSSHRENVRRIGIAKAAVEKWMEVVVKISTSKGFRLGTIYIDFHSLLYSTPLLHMGDCLCLSRNFGVRVHSYMSSV